MFIKCLRRPKAADKFAECQCPFTCHRLLDSLTRRQVSRSDLAQIHYLMADGHLFALFSLSQADGSELNSPWITISMCERVQLQSAYLLWNWFWNCQLELFCQNFGVISYIHALFPFWSCSYWLFFCLCISQESPPNMEPIDEYMHRRFLLNNWLSLLWRLNQSKVWCGGRGGADKLEAHERAAVFWRFPSCSVEVSLLFYARLELIR